ncbi:MAG TPA: ABC transporter ATP-binding protein [Solirubrobacteraceae bacterium]|jgi:iron(III) transport system ATP-binding protein|nr:ABC transporter ATP-binding protein [Solirubrobacteraceae bacterium]
MSASALSIASLRKSFGATPVLGGLDLEVAHGSLTAVLGPSGCGKTTLLRLIAGFERADGGTIRVGERIVSDERTHLAPEQRGVGFVAQEGALFPHLDVAANIAFGLARSQRQSGRVQELLELVGLAGLAKRRPHELSGGQQQRVALARALAPSPQLVLLDEPFDALDAGLRTQVRAEVRAVLRQSGATALLVTHDQQEALSLADVVAVMRAGTIVQAADPQTLYRDPLDPELAGFLGEAVLLTGELHAGHADTALGRLPTRGANGLGATHGSVMLRPEQILCSEPLAGAPRGRVLATQFYGHDATARISLADPASPQITARAAGHRLPQVGDEVSLVVEGTALAFPAPQATRAMAPESASGGADGAPGTAPGM